LPVEAIQPSTSVRHWQASLADDTLALALWCTTVSGIHVDHRKHDQA
jgi:hypothetical protein